MDVAPQQLEPEALITTVTEGYDRISMHGVRRELLARQADAVGTASKREDWLTNSGAVAQDARAAVAVLLKQ